MDTVLGERDGDGGMDEFFVFKITFFLEITFYFGDKSMKRFRCWRMQSAVGKLVGRDSKLWFFESLVKLTNTMLCVTNTDDDPVL